MVTFRRLIIIRRRFSNNENVENMEYAVIFVCRNLLRPAGVQLQPATFKLKVYYAEDLPRSEFCCYVVLLSLLQKTAGCYFLLCAYNECAGCDKKCPLIFFIVF